MLHSTALNLRILRRSVQSATHNKQEMSRRLAYGLGGETTYQSPLLQANVQEPVHVHLLQSHQGILHEFVFLLLAVPCYLLVGCPLILLLCGISIEPQWRRGAAVETAKKTLVHDLI